MAHKGERKTRSARPERIPKLGRYVIVTDTDETEKNYFEGLKANLPEASRKNYFTKNTYHKELFDEKKSGNGLLNEKYSGY